MEIPETDLRIQVYRVPPNQNWAGSHKPLVVITHLPTGIEVQCDEEASALQNKVRCLEMLFDALEDEQGYSPVPTEQEAREWVVDRLAWEQYDWDTIAESFDPPLSQEGCDVIMEALCGRHTVTVTWQDGQSITYPPPES